MPEKPKPKPPDNAEQSARFVDKAKELGSDETGKAFEKAFPAVVAPKRPSSKDRK